MKPSVLGRPGLKALEWHMALVAADVSACSTREDSGNDNGYVNFLVLRNMKIKNFPRLFQEVQRLSGQLGVVSIQLLVDPKLPR